MRQLILSLILVCLIAGCAGSPSPSDQAALTRLAVTLDKSQDCLDAESINTARLDLTQLGASLADVQRARVAAEIWDKVKPVLTVGVSLFIDWLGGSK